MPHHKKLPSLRATRPSVFEPLESRALFSTTYTLVDLGTVDGGNHTFDPAVNAAGLVVGTGTDDQGHGRAFLYSGGSTLADLGLPTGTADYFANSAVGINAAGQVAANVFINDTYRHHALLGSTGGGFVDLGTGGDAYDDSLAYGLNSTGTVVGKLYNSVTTATHAFVSQGGSLHDLGNFPTTGFNSSIATAINDAGTIVGNATMPAPTLITFPTNHAFLYQNGAFTDLGAPAGFKNSFATAINAAGQIAIYADGNGTHAFIYSNGSFQDLGNIGGNGTVTDINDAGQVVGQIVVGTADHAFVYSDGQLLDLNTLIPANSGWTLGSATSINNAGQIVGNGVIDGHYRAFLLNPSTTTPPPVTDGTLAPTITSNSLPTHLLAGAAAHGSLTVTIANSSATKFTGPITLTVKATSSTAAVTLATLKTTVTILPHKTTKVTLNIKSLPRALKAGTYSLIAQTVDAKKVATTATKGPTLTVTAPVISFKATLSKVTPATAKKGQPATVILTLTNTGNVDSTGPLTLTTGYATSPASAILTHNHPTTQKLTLHPGKPIHLTLTLPPLTTPGTYLPYVTLKKDKIAITTFGLVSFTVLAK